MNKIVRIIKKKNIKIQNLHNNMVYPIQDILLIEFEKGKTRTIDLFSEKDITDINYFKVIETGRTQYKTIMEDQDFFSLPF